MNLHPYETSDIPKLLGIPWNIQMVNAPSFWSITKGVGTIVAVIDTGLDVRHPEFKGRIVEPRNFTGTGAYNDVSDLNGHGTHVSGTIAGATTGVAPEAKIMPLKVFGGPDVNGAINEAFLHIYNWNAGHPEDERVVAVNCSFGSTTYDAIMAYHIRRLVNSGVTVVVAAGNSGDGKADTEEVFSYPAYIHEVVTTAALNQDGQNAGYSNSFDGIDLAAPGTLVYSAWPGGGYKLLSGTSMATPHITGAMALIYSAWRDREGEWPASEQAYKVLMKHVAPSTLGDNFVGDGILDLTWQGKRWPLYRIQMGAFFNEDGCTTQERAIKLLIEPHGFKTYRTKY